MSRTVRRAAVLAVATTVALVGGTGIASAHVRVSSDDAAPGGYGVMTFRVPNESATATTVSIRIQLPTDTPLTSVSAEPVPGWTITETTTALNPPATTDDGDTVNQAVSVVQFAADAGGGIAPGQFQQFRLLGGPFPDAASLTLPVVQTYSDGSQAAWIEPTVEGQAEPQNPAPVLTLSAGGSGTSDAHGGSTDEGSAGTTGTTGAASTDGGGDGLAVTALVLGGLGLVAGVAGLALGLGARRRTVAE